MSETQKASGSVDGSAELPHAVCGYPIARQLGAGSFLAHDERGRAIVLKPLAAGCLLQEKLHPAIVERLNRLREIPTLHVANLLGVERDGKENYLIWQYVHGEPIETILQRTVDPANAARLMSAARSAAGAMHARGLVHGAIHGRNLIVDTAGSVHLTHASPLLFNDPDIDHAALDRLRSLAPANADIGASPTATVFRGERRISWSSAAMAIIVCGVGVLVAMTILWIVHRGART